MSRDTVPLYQPPVVYCYATGIGGASLPNCGNGSAIVPVGTTLVPYNYLSCWAGDFDDAYCEAKIIVNGVTVKSCARWLQTNEYINCNYDSEYSFQMPNSEVTVVLEGWAWDEVAEDWNRYYVKTYTLNPQTQKCNQPVRVEDENGNSLNNVWVYARHGSEPALSCKTYEGSNNPGECTIASLDVGKSYMLEADPSGYSPDSKKIVACTGTRETLVCRKEINYATLNVCLRDINDTELPISGAIVSIAGVGSCTTGGDGCCALTIVKGTPYWVSIQKTGYVNDGFSITCNDSYCSRTRYLTPSACTQEVRVIDQYGTGVAGCVIAAKQSGVIKKQCTTGSDGRCVLTSLDYGEMYDLEVTSIPTGYECVNCSKSITACGSEQVFTVTSGTPRVDTYLEFSIQDPNEVEASNLIVGTQYALRAWLKTVDGDQAIQNAVLWFRKPTGDIGSCTTDENGYCGIYWTPTDQDIGSYNLRAQFDGSTSFKESVNYKAITVEEPVMYKNFNATFGIGYGFDRLTNYLGPIISEIVAKINEIGLSDEIIIRSISSQPTKETLTINFDTLAQSPVSDEVKNGIIVGVKAGILAACIANPILAPIVLLVMAALKFIGIFSTEPYYEVAGFIKALRYSDNQPLASITFTLSDGQEVTTDSNGKATFKIGKSDTLTIKEAIDPIGEYAPGMDSRDTSWMDAVVGPGTTTVVFFHFAEFSEAFDIPVIISGGEHDGEPAVGAYVVLSNPEREGARWSALTDQNGMAHFEGNRIERLLWTATAMVALESTSYYDQKILDLQQTPYIIPVLEIAHKYTITKVTLIEGTPHPLIGCMVRLINEQTDELVDERMSDKYGNVTFFIEPSDTTTYRLEQEKEGYNSDMPAIIPNIPGDQPSQQRDDLERTGDICDVNIHPMNAETHGLIPDAIVTLYGNGTSFGPQPSSQTFIDVPYGDYIVEVLAEGFVQSEAELNKIWTVGPPCKDNGGCLCIFKPSLDNAYGPSTIPIECIVEDEKGNRVPNAIISIEYNSISPVPIWDNYPITQEDVISGTVVTTKDGYLVECTSEGYCKFVLAPIGAQLEPDLTKIDAYRLKASHSNFYNEDGNKGKWTETIEIVQTPPNTLVFTLYTSPPSNISKLIIYGCTTAGLAIGGTVVKTKRKDVGTAIQLSSLIPLAFTIYESYKIIKDKWPIWLGG